MPDASLYLLEEAAAKLDTLLERIVFVGGSTLGLLIADSGAAPVRPTIDVDVIVEITTYPEYVHMFSPKLKACGFREDTREGAPICRWICDDLILDVMPLNEEVLGFSNQWYRGAFQEAQRVTLPSGKLIQAITAPFFLATKIEAFRGRGKRDYHESRDLEDFVSVVDGRNSIVEELFSAPLDLRAFLAKAAGELLTENRFQDALPGYLLPDEISQQRLPGVLRKFKEISRM